jgi:hypothetical protein
MAMDSLNIEELSHRKLEMVKNVVVVTEADEEPPVSAFGEVSQVLRLSGDACAHTRSTMSV